MPNTPVNPLENTGKAARAASYILAGLSTGRKNKLLNDLADALEAEKAAVLAANAEDMAEAEASGMTEPMRDRLLLTAGRIKDMADDVRHVARLEDPVGKVLGGRTLDGGLRLSRLAVPLGVVAAVYEARPNVTVDIASLCLKTGNAVILRGGKETVRSNAALAEVIHQALALNSLPGAAVQAVTSPDRSLVKALLELDSYVDMLIPRGGSGLHRFCRENSRIPVITGGIGVCHIFVDESADQARALSVLENAKIQRPSVCNAVETVLVHEAIAAVFIPAMAEYLGSRGVILHSALSAVPYLEGVRHPVKAVEDGDLDKEWLTLDLNVAVVPGLDEAVAHIRRHGSGHSDAILTENMANAEAFVASVDSAAVYVNASTRFTDGGQFGLGAEVAISTQKLHARGPMALEALTTYKWVGRGDYTIRA